MDGLSRPAAPDTIVKIPKGWPGPLRDGFDEWHWPPMRLEEYAVVEAHLLKDRKTPIDAVLPELERLSKIKTKAARRLARVLEERAYEDLKKSKAQHRLSIEEAQAWINTPDGSLFTMKLCLQRRHPDITDAQVRTIFDWMGDEEARRQRERMEGSDALGNSTGPTHGDGGTGVSETDPPGSTGEVSFGGSRASTAGSTTT